MKWGELQILTIFMLKRYQGMDLWTWFKIPKNVSYFLTASSKIMKTFLFFFKFVIFLNMGKQSDFPLSYFQL